MGSKRVTGSFKVWLAALRQADQQNQNQNLICEDHFLPEDVLSGDVSADAIPIMPPCLDGPLDPLDRWGAGSEDDEDQWVGTAGPGEEEEEEGCLPFNTKMAASELPALDPTEQVRISSWTFTEPTDPVLLDQNWPSWFPVELITVVLFPPAEPGSQSGARRSDSWVSGSDLVPLWFCQKFLGRY